MNQHWSYQASRFFGVGGMATFTHVTAAYLATLAFPIPPLGANLVGFVCAVGVSYFGNFYWTFGKRTEHSRHFARFAVSSIICFLLSNGIVFVTTTLLKWRFEAALFLIVMAIPPLSFSLAKFWAFRSDTEAEDKTASITVHEPQP